MKISLTILSFSSLALLSGCVTQPLAINEHGPRLAEPLGVELVDIQFLNYCGYRIIPETQTKDFNTLPGIIAVTNNELSIATGNLSSAGKKAVIKIPIDEIDGLAQIGDQLQIKHGDQLLVVFIYGMYRYQVSSDREYELVHLLSKLAVPRYEAEFAFNQKSRRYSNDFVNPPPNNYEGQFSDRRQYPYTAQDGSVYNTGAGTRSTP
jgi:hypothetical protein